jgi:hypothetical protein
MPSFASHRDQRNADLVANGMAPEEARFHVGDDIAKIRPNA